jgi:hypothetical protein
MDDHRKMLKKSDVENMQEDNGEGSDRFADQWGLLVDKGYQGIYIVATTISDITIIFGDAGL